MCSTGGKVTGLARLERGGKMGRPEKWWRERWRRQEAAYLSPDASDAEIIEAVTDYLIANGSTRRPYRLHLSILNIVQGTTGFLRLEI